MKRVSALKALLDNLAQHLLLKLRASDAFRARFIRSLSSLKEVMLERRKIVAIVGEERLEKDQIFKEVENSLETISTEIHQVACQCHRQLPKQQQPV